jgi:hypothetical protein
MINTSIRVLFLIAVVFCFFPNFTQNPFKTRFLPEIEDELIGTENSRIFLNNYDVPTETPSSSSVQPKLEFEFIPLESSCMKGTVYVGTRQLVSTQ